MTVPPTPFKGRLPPDQWYPAHEPGLEARRLDLGGGDVVRVIEGGSGSGPPVVFLHGWGCSAYFFRKLMPAVIASGRPVVALDQRGHGGSSKPTDERCYTGEGMRAFVERTLNVLRLRRLHLVAHSLGGAVALDVAAANPQRVASLTLLAPVGLAPVRFVTLARVATPLVAAPLVPYAVPRWSIPLVLRAVYGSEGAWASRDVDEYWAPTGDPAFAMALRALLHHYRFLPRSDADLEAITAPVLALFGLRDLLVRTTASHNRASRREGWVSEVIPAAGHVLGEEVPDVVLDRLLPHLARSG